MLGSKYRNEGKDAEKRDNERWDGGKGGGRWRGSDSESSRDEGSDSSDVEASRRNDRRSSERDEKEKDRERRRGSERRGREIEKPRKRLEEEEDGSRRRRDVRDRNRRRDSDSESGGEERDRYRSVRREEDRPKKKLEEEEDGGEVGDRKGGDDRQKNGNLDNDSERSGEARDRKRSERREQDLPKKNLDEEESSKVGNMKRRDGRQRNGRRGNDSESSSDERDRRRSERREQDQPRKKLNEEDDIKVENRKRRDGGKRTAHRESDSESSDEEKDRKRSEKQEKEQPKKRLDVKEDSKVGNRKGRDNRQRNGHRENDSESSGEERDNKRSERQEKQQARRRSDEEEEKEDEKERTNEGRHIKRRSRRQRSDSESSGREERHRDRGRRRRERESRRHRYDSDGSSDSDGHRRRHSRRRSVDRSGKQRRDYEDGEVRSTRERKEIAPDLKQDNREGKEEEATKPQIQSHAENVNPGGDLSTLGRTGGVYIPPFKLFRMMKEIEDKSSMEYQRLTWDALRKSINGLVNKVNATNIKNIIPELLGENLIRGRGLFCRSCMKSQMASPGFTDVFAALVAVVNTKFPEIGDLLLKRIILQLKRAYKRNDKPQLIAAVKFIAHLVNQQVAHELVALELLTILLEQPTDDSVEVAVDFVKECGCILQDLCPKGLHGIFERFRGILHEGEIDKRVQFLIEGLFAVRKAKFQGHPAVRPELDLVEPEDQLTHEVSLEDEIDPEIGLDIFKQDPNFLENEKRYEELKKSILGDESEDDEGSDAGSEDADDDEEEDEDDEEQQMQIKDETETNLINLRRTIYLTIMSSVDFEEAGHKLLKIKLEPGQEMELCIMLLECCSQERTYLRYYGLLGQRFCMINKVYQENFDKCFVQQYSMIHRLETNKLRNVAKFFAHLLGTDALPWHVLAYIRLTEEDTTSSSRIFIKILFQELSEHLGIRLLNERLNDPSMQDSFDSIFPKDNPRNTRFAINFFTSIGLGGITENLREYLKNMPRMIMQQQQPQSEDEPDSSSSGSGSSTAESDSDSSSSSSSSSSEESSRDNDRRRKRKKADSGGDRHRKRRK